MTEQEARKWLNDVIVAARSAGAMREHDLDAATEIKKLLAQPRLPDELSPELIEAIWCATGVSGNHRVVAHAVLKAIRDWVTRPRTKREYRLTFSLGHASSDCHPTDADAALQTARQLTDAGYTVTITPIEVPT